MLSNDMEGVLAGQPLARNVPSPRLPRSSSETGYQSELSDFAQR